MVGKLSILGGLFWAQMAALLRSFLGRGGEERRFKFFFKTYWGFGLFKHLNIFTIKHKLS